MCLVYSDFLNIESEILKTTSSHTLTQKHIASQNTPLFNNLLSFFVKEKPYLSYFPRKNSYLLFQNEV